MQHLMRDGASDPRALPIEDEKPSGCLAPPSSSLPFWRFASGERLSVRFKFSGRSIRPGFAADPALVRRRARGGPIGRTDA